MTMEQSGFYLHSGAKYALSRASGRMCFGQMRTDHVLAAHGVLEEEHGGHNDDDALEAVADGVRHGRHALQDHV